jgi:hypothetical protein
VVMRARREREMQDGGRSHAGTTDGDLGLGLASSVVYGELGCGHE